MRWLALILAIAVAGEMWFLWSRRAPDPISMFPEVRFVAGTDDDQVQAMYRDAVARAWASGSREDLLAVPDMLLAYGQHREAARVYRALALADPGDAAAWRGLAMSLDSLGDLDGALYAYRAALARGSDLFFDPLLRHRMGELLQMRGDLAGARQAYVDNGDHPSSRYRLIRLLLRAGERDAAATGFAEMLADPDLAVAAEPAQLNDLSLRLYGEVIAPIPEHPRQAICAYLPIDMARIAIEDRYGLPFTRLIAARLAEAAPTPIADGLADAATVRALLDDPIVIAQGRAVYAANACGACHGVHAFGGLGPNLRDDFWLGSATPVGIHQAITQGRPGSAMAGHASLLRPDQIRDLTIYLLALHGETGRENGRTLGGKAPEGALQRMVIGTEE